MSTLRSALDKLGAEDLRFASNEALEDDLVDIERAGRSLEAERLRRVAELVARGSFARDGYLPMSAWIVYRLHAPGRRRGSRCGWRVAPPDAPRARGARDAVDRGAATMDAERARERRRLHVSQALDGTVRVDGDLDADTGQVIITALRAVMSATSRHGSDRRTTPQRRADALGEICHQWWAAPTAIGGRGASAPHRHFDLETLERRAGRRCELDDAGRIVPDDARRIACERFGEPGHHGGAIHAGRGRPPDACDPGDAPPGGRRAGPRVSVPGVRPATRLVRRPPHQTLR